MSDKVPLKNGLRVRIVKGDAPDPQNPEWEKHVNWIAGPVPIGAVGTIYTETTANNFTMFAIDFPDHPILSDKIGRYFRGLGGSDLSENYEVVEEDTRKDGQ